MKEKLQKEIQWLLEEKYGGVETPAFFADVQRLKKNEPLDYIIGWKEFLGCRIDLSRHPFIPRSETEFWASKAIEDIKKHSNILENVGMSEGVGSIRCLDLCAGSGCIGVAVLKHISKACVDFAEYDEKLLEQIRINAKLNVISPDRYRVFQSDIFSEVRDQYDYIFANPPYLAHGSRTKRFLAVRTDYFLSKKFFVTFLVF
jgi:release factor glutamine methyltransferase